MKLLQPAGSAAASGSMGGNTAARNRYGAYMRAKVTPVNPQSALQSAQRSRFALLVAAWSTLTTAQRDAWEVYANATPKNDVFGQPITLPGRQVFIGSNALRLQAGLTIVEDGPTELTIPGLTAPVPTITAGDPASVVFTTTDQWAGEVGGALLLFLSPPKSPTRSFHRNPYRYAGKIAGAGTPPTSPATIPVPYVYTAGQKCFWKAVALTADGRVSADAYGFQLVGA